MPCVWLLFQSPLKKTKVPECSHGLRQVLVWAAEHLHRLECSSVSVRNMPRRLLPREKQAVPATAAAGRVKLAVLLAAVVLFAAVLFAPTRAFCSAPGSGEGEGEG